MSYELINQYFEVGLFLAEDIAVFEAAGYLTEKQAREITEAR